MIPGQLWIFIYLLPGARGPRNAHDGHSEAHAGQGQTQHTSKGPKHATNTHDNKQPCVNQMHHVKGQAVVAGQQVALERHL